LSSLVLFGYREVEDRFLGRTVLDDNSVDLIASGYEWECPECEELHREIEYREQVACCACGKVYETNPPEHAYG